ncbi:Pol Polyprotein [Phytophthora megakarya]|uniref:Pol Polyprotein n=1 Tax=Phytophthora megakarya TaxID=4795 RepID=A0A225WQT5_9STRA|nr:Pol Polyprotein [Phytophthora megakarya]
MCYVAAPKNLDMLAKFTFLKNINVLYNAIQNGDDFTAVDVDGGEQSTHQIHTVNAKNREKSERQTTTDKETFRKNPAFSLIEKYHPIFRIKLPKRKPVHGEHEMELAPGHGAIFRPLWRLSPEQTETLRYWLKEMLEAGLIRPSISPHGAPTFCIKKPVGWRIAHDYRAMSQHTIRQSIPMPREDDIFDRMAGCRWYSCFDLLSGYYQIRMRESDIPLTTFLTPDGLFEYLAVPMGLSNAPATFNRIVTRCFWDLSDCVATYFDDIYVFPKDEGINGHLTAVERVFHKCQEQLKLAKSTICSREIPCLGEFVGINGVRIDPDKVTIITEWPVPKTVKELRSILGATVYVQRFCALHQFSRCQISRDQFEFGGILIQVEPASEKVEGKFDDTKTQSIERPIAFTGRKLTSTELNYPTH